MANNLTPYITRNPGDMVTAEDWNDVQIKIKEDIGDQVQTAIGDIQSVPHADDADTLQGNSAQALKEEIINAVLNQIPEKTGYMQVFKRLEYEADGEASVIEHNLHAFPIVDVYQLDYFQVACSEDDIRYRTWATFYLYHTSEKRIRFREETSDTLVTVEIEPSDSHFSRTRFSEMLDLYQVEYTDSSSLGNLETEFWDAFFGGLNDQFDDAQVCHSPWFDRCCGEGRTVGSLKASGDWDDIWFQIRPQKTINHSPADVTDDPDNPNPVIAPPNIQVTHRDFNTLGIKLLDNPGYPDDPENYVGIEARVLNVMLLLKV